MTRGISGQLSAGGEEGSGTVFQHPKAVRPKVWDLLSADCTTHPAPQGKLSPARKFPASAGVLEMLSAQFPGEVSRESAEA